MRIRYGSEKEKRGDEKDGERKRQSRRGGDIGEDIVQRRREVVIEMRKEKMVLKEGEERERN